MVRLAGLTLFALLLMAPAAGASTFGMSGDIAVFSGDASADRVLLERFDQGDSWYLLTDDGGITPEKPCVRVTSTMAGCKMVAGHDYRLATGGGADTVTIASGVPTGTTNLGPGDSDQDRSTRGIFRAVLTALVAAALLAPAWTPGLKAANDYADGRPGEVSFAVRTEKDVWGRALDRQVQSASVVKALLLVAYLRQPDVRSRALTSEERHIL